MMRDVLKHLRVFIVMATINQAAGAAGEPYDANDFRRMRVLDAWAKYDGVLSWGKGQCLAILDDGCNLDEPEWQATLPWGKKVIATYDSIDGDADPSPGPAGYHGTSVGYPSSLNHGGKLGVAFNDYVAQVRCVSTVHLRSDEARTMADALQWAIDNHEKYTITAVNLSPLDDQSHTKTVPTAVDAPLKTLRELGIWVSAPSGNNEHTDGISWPACAEHCFAIGATQQAADVVYRDRFSNTDILVPAAATSSSNAYIAAASMILREAIEKSGYRWQADGTNLADAMMAIFKKTGVGVHDSATKIDFKRLDMLAALDYMFANGKATNGK